MDKSQQENKPVGFIYVEAFTNLIQIFGGELIFIVFDECTDRFG